MSNTPMEQNITKSNLKITLVSIAISLKRIADILSMPNGYGEVGAPQLARAIKEGLEMNYEHRR